MDELLGLFRYPPGSGRALLAGTLPLWYCAARFACSTPTWRLPVSGQVSGLVAAYVGAVREAFVDGAGQEVHWVSGSGSGTEKNSTKQKKLLHTSRGLWFKLVHGFGRGCVMLGILVFPFLITRGGVVIRMMRGIILLRSGLGLGNSLVLCLRLQVCTSL